MENVKVIIQKVVAILTVFIIIMSQYVITGLIETTYAIDLLATQSDNVQFRAYFKNGEEELTEIESNIAAKDLKLKIDIAVKNEGYFKGQISLENAGFKLTQAIENNYIREVKDNVIYLNQINAEETVNIEVGIEYLEEDEINVTTLKEATTVKLKGTYTSSKGNVEIDSGSDVKVTWKMPENTKAELAAKLQTNEVYKVNEENKKVVQFLILSKLTNNAYPIKNTEIKATIPEGATKVEVQKRTTKSTNGEKDFTEENYNTENNILTINVNNDTVEGKISWMKGVQDIYVVTYEYPENVYLDTQNITINEAITTYDTDKTTGNYIVLNAEQVQISLSESKDGIASVSKVESETQIYKGKIYSGEERDFTSYTMVYVDYVDGVKDIEISEEEAKYTKEIEENGTKTTEESNANVEIKTLKINKDKVASVLGEDWNLTVGETVINKETTSSENGDIELQMPEGTKTITIKTSKPVNNGAFVIETTKTILDAGYTREQIREFKYLEDSSSVKYTKNDNNIFKFTSSFNIGLKETESKASLQCEQQALIASGDTQQLNMIVVLESSGEHQDLYKNPTIKIKLPSQIKDVTYAQKPQLMYANNELELTDNNYTISEKNGQKMLNINLTGEQTRYLGESVQGVTLLIKTTVNINPKAENSEEEIVLTYTNENATKYTDQGTEKVNVQIIANPDQNQNQNQQQGGSQNGNDNQNENEELIEEITSEVGGEKINQGDTIKAGEIITYTAKVANIGNSEKTGLTIETTIPENTTLVEINPLYPGQYENSEAFSYTEPYYIEKTDNKIVKENVSIKSGKEYIIKYSVKVKKDLTEAGNAITKLTVKENNAIKREAQLSSNIEPAELVLELTPYGRESNSSVEYNMGAVYMLKIFNNTNTVKENVKVTINKNELIDINSIEFHSGDTTQNINKENLTFTIPAIPVNDLAYIRISGTIQKYTDKVNVAQLSAIAENSNKKYKSNIVAEEVVGEKVSIELNTKTTSKNTNKYVESGDTITYTGKIKNIGKTNVSDLTINTVFSNYLDLQSVKLNGESINNYIVEQHFEEDEPYDVIKIENVSIIKGKEINIEIKGKVSDNLPQKDNLKIMNKVTAYGSVGLITETEDNIYYVNGIKEEYVEPDDNESDDNKDNDDGNNNNNDNNNDDKDSSDSKGYTISGLVWKDEDKNGERQQGETLVSGIRVSLIDVNTNNIITNSQTDSDGKYSFTNLERGKYMVAFEFDTNKYDVTTYKAKGVSDNRNSDAVKVDKVIDNQEKKVAITDILEINSKLTDIDLGLITTQKGSVKIEKTISKIIVTNKEGTKKYSFKNTNLAKVEIASKYLSGSNVAIEYKFRIKNDGNTSIYIKNIIDNLPSSLEFNSSINEDWYKKNGNLYNSKLNNSKLNVGEEKVVSLVLIKKMTASNTGLVNNKATIESVYNSDGTGNSNNDTSTADVIISIKTGEAITYISFIGISVIILFGVVFFVKKKVWEIIKI